MARDQRHSVHRLRAPPAAPAASAPSATGHACRRKRRAEAGPLVLIDVDRQDRFGDEVRLDDERLRIDEPADAGVLPHPLR